MIQLEEIRHALTRHYPRLRQAGPRGAAVAVILAGPERDLSMCFIRRAESKRDVWSGHIALPGGHASPEDGSAADVAERETQEEVGLPLDASHRAGVLPDVMIRLAGREEGLALSPITYFVGERLAPLRPGSEVAEAFWVRLAVLWDARNGTHLVLRDGPDVLAYPAIKVGNHVIWGITLRVLTLFSDVIGLPLPHLEEIPGLRDENASAKTSGS